MTAWCGSAWHKLRGELELYHADGEHMNPLGAYLNACVLAKAIFDVDPVSLPDKIQCKALTGTIQSHEIHRMQKAAAEA